MSVAAKQPPTPSHEHSLMSMLPLLWQSMGNPIKSKFVPATRNRRLLLHQMQLPQNQPTRVPRHCSLGKWLRSGLPDDDGTTSRGEEDDATACKASGFDCSFSLLCEAQIEHHLLLIRMNMHELQVLHLGLQSRAKRCFEQNCDSTAYKLN